MPLLPQLGVTTSGFDLGRSESVTHICPLHSIILTMVLEHLIAGVADMTSAGMENDRSPLGMKRCRVMRERRRTEKSVGENVDRCGSHQVTVYWHSPPHLPWSHR